MTTTTTENSEHSQVWFRTREQTARLLEELRELYQLLSCAEQKLIRGEVLCEAETAWSVLRSLNAKQEVLVDMANVSFVDECGALLLAKMRREGAKLAGSGLLIAALIEEIEQAEAAEEDVAGPRPGSRDYEGEVGR